MTKGKRRVHLGIDYGTSASKVVLRDYGAPGGEEARIVTEGTTWRFSSAVAVSRDTLHLGAGDDPTVLSHGNVVVHHSVKMRVADEATGSTGRYYHLPVLEIPAPFTSDDLAVLTLARLITIGALRARQWLGDDIRLGMTIGVPMSFFDDAAVRSRFLDIARTAWEVWRLGGVQSRNLPFALAKKLLADARDRVAGKAVPDEKSIRYWVRSEAEAAVWSTYLSPSVPAGPYAKIDIGAGITHASVFRILESHLGGQWVKNGLAFYGAYSAPVGMDALDVSLAAWMKQTARVPMEPMELRGREGQLLKDQTAVAACQDAIEKISRAYAGAWKQCFDKCKDCYTERQVLGARTRTFVIGGGSHVECLRSIGETNPMAGGLRRKLLEVERPSDLRLQSNLREATVLPFTLVAYGLSVLDLAILPVQTPREIPPMTAETKRRAQLDADEIYAK